MWGAGVWASVLCAHGMRAQASAALVRDSSGIQIVTNRVSEATPRWRLSAQPILEIRSSETDTLMMYPEIHYPYRMAKGQIAFLPRKLNSTGYELMGSGFAFLFDDQGNFVRRIGRVGRGPGESLGISRIFPLGEDSLLFLDGMLQRGTVMSLTTGYVRSYPVSSWSVPPAGVFSDGSLVFVDARRDPSFVLNATFYRLDAGGNRRNRIAGPLMYLPSNQEVWGARATMAVWGNELYYGSPTGYEVSVFSAEGRFVRIIRLEKQRHRTTAADVDAFKALNGRLATLFPGGKAPDYSHHQFAEYLQAIENILVDRDGNLWLQEGSVERWMQPQQWLVFDREGRLQGTLETPARMLVTDIGRDYVLGSCHDQDWQASVCMYALKK